MSFTPVLPLTGYTGWTFLKRTMEVQKEAYTSTPVMQRDEEYFRQNIAKIQSAEDLVSDRRLLKVALGAFGLDDDINNKYFIQKVLSDGTTSKDALSSKLADKAYAKLSAAFGFGEGETPATQTEGFADTILTAYEARQFEIAVGDQDDTMRLALNAERELSELAAKTSSDDTKWFTVMGSEPLREVFETALGLPDGFVSLDLDQQLQTLREKTKALTGDGEISQFSDPDQVEALVRRYLIRAEIESGAISSMTPGAGALMILQSGSSNASYSILSALYS
ncbi:MAG: DUF1217 domain-containing protein [Paracoccaceae bacterium]